MSTELEFRMKVQNDLLNSVNDNIEALRKFAKVEEEVNNSERQIGKDLLASFSEREKASARQAQSTLKQSQALDQMAGVIEKVRKANSSVAGDASKALSSLKSNEAEIKGIYDELTKLDAKGQDLIKNVARAADSGNVEEVGRLMDEFQKGLDPEQAKAFAQGMEEGFEKVEVAINRPTKELRELKRQMQAGELEGDELEVAIRRAAELEDEIGDVQQRIKALSSDTFTLDAVVGGFEALAGGAAVAEGAIALMGVENEDFQETMIKLNALMAISQGLQSVSNQLLGDGAFKTKLISSAQSVYAAAVGTSTGAMKGFRTALLATGIGAAVIAIGALVANWDKLSEAISGTSVEQKINAQISEKAIDSVAEEVTALDVKLLKINELAVGEKERTRLIQELQAEYPNYLGNIDAESVTTDDLTKSVIKLKDAYVLKAKIRAAEELLVEANKKSLQLENQAVKESLTLTEKFLRGAQSVFDAGAAGRGAYGDALENRSEENAKITSEIDALNKVITEGAAQLEAIGGDPEQVKSNGTKVLNNNRKANNDILKEQERAQAEQLRARESFYDEMSKLFDDANDAEIESLIGEAKLAALAAVEDEKISVIEESTKLLAQQAGFQGDELAAKYVEIEKYIGQLRLDAERKATDDLIQFRADQAANQIDASNESLQQQEEIEINRAAVRLESQRASFENEQAFEDFKNQELLKINLAYAQKRLELLQGSTDAESEVQKSQLERTISELKSQIETVTPEAAAEKEGSFLQGLLGLDDEGLASFKEAAASAADALLGLYATANAARIQDAENQIKASDDILTQLNAQLDEEKGLKAEGLANNVTAVEKEIAEEKKRREAALKEKQKLQKRQALIDAAVQASSLITATAQIFAAESTKGLAGVLVAVGAIASLFAIFAATKSKIKAASTQLRHGGSGDKTGMFTGRSHEQGGEKFLDHVEVESDEAWGVLSRPASRKYGNAFHKMVEAMNNGNFNPSIVKAPMVPAVAFVRDADFEGMRYGRAAQDSDRLRLELEKTNLKLDKMHAKLSEIEAKPTSWNEGDTTVVKKGMKVVKTRTNSF
jgi:hypothetical protein